MFAKSEIDERDELPGCFGIENFNFNPHQIMGSFDYTNNKPQLMQTN